MPEIKEMLTEDMVKQALRSAGVDKALKDEVRKKFEADIDAYVDEVMDKLAGKAQADEPANKPTDGKTVPPVDPGKPEPVTILP